ncbi:hypothetical protein NLX83_16155 [Allokutzneria sp. A3M-2-11 16]|uniref:hypothetical protein n=1 Tax=Allokutzneria sp. A3M-2-11 16 TaxID=2962043 RepID=UPI0020B6E63D|nr:hypothetical protein [Allokutzneria sp. A3M-2-11 16]MCP3800800.1 hypothetical protein [Allokutzneria sp. A3M-2-11 16]
MWNVRVVVAAALLVAAIVSVSWVGARGQADAEPGFEVPRAPVAQQPAARQAVPVPDAGAAEQVRSAPQGRVIARGPAMVADEIASHTDRAPLIRLTISGDFPVRSLDYTVLVDGQAVGRGIPTEDLNAIRVALPQPRTGAVVSYRYGDGQATTVGPLKVEGK